MSWKSLNAVFRKFSSEQGVDPGSKWWLEGGMNLLPSNTGGQESYGWRHTHKVDAYGKDFVLGSICNYADRPIFYLNAPVRSSGYEYGGRPIGYFPETEWDLDSGGALYPTSKGNIEVRGEDAQHCELSPLFAVADSEGYTAKAHGEDVDASYLAKIILRFHMKAIRGFIMKTESTITSYIFGDRGTSVIMNNLNQAVKAGCIDSDDLAWLSKYVLEVILPAYQKPSFSAPGSKGSEGFNPPMPTDAYFTQLYNGLYWTLPPFYDAWVLCPESKAKDDLWEIVKRFSTYMEDLEKANPGKGFPSALTVPIEVVQGIDGKAVPSWSPYITAANMFYSNIDWSLWGMRAQAISAKVLGSKIMEDASIANVAKWKAKAASPGYKYAIDDKSWMVGADGEYL